MNTHAHKIPGGENRSVANDVAQRKENKGLSLASPRQQVPLQKKLQQMMNTGAGAKGAIQQLKPGPKNKTGLPDQLKTGIENLSGYAMDDVKVHYNSGKPAQLQAHAYAQGTDIHVAPGQERHLAHEAWHVVQQKQGRVKPTLQMKGRVNINDDKGLEKEADVMGKRAEGFSGSAHTLPLTLNAGTPLVQTVQRLKMEDNPDKKSDAKEFFKLRYAEGDATNCAHNYAFINSLPGQWAKSSGSGHAETQLTGLYAQDDTDLYIVSELKPCDACQAFLPKVEAARNMEITVYHNLDYKDTGDGNKAAILEMYQGYKWLSKDARYTTSILSEGKKVLGIQ